MNTQTENRVRQFTVNMDDMATIICPHCGFEKDINALGFKDITTPMQFHCKCGNAFHGVLNFRPNHFKRVRLEGRLVNMRTGDKEDMVVEILSMDGLGFRTFGPHGLAKGDALRVEFVLDNLRETEIRREVKVTSIRDEAVGAVFRFKPAYDPDLGFYLMP